MAETLDGVRLTELHRLLQVRLSTQAMAATRLLWSTLDPADLGKARDIWLRQQLQLMKVYDQKSALAAADYMQKFRVVEGFSSGPIEAVDGFDAGWAESSLDDNGPGVIGAARYQGVAPEVAKQQALSQFLAASQRIALGGGRRVMDQSSLANPDSAGWRRVSDGSPCSFCAMLVSRGPAYRSQKSAGAGRHYHRRCGCSVEESFGEDWQPTAKEQRFVDAYDAAAAHLDSEGKPHTQGNILGHMRENGKFNDSPVPKDAKPEPRQLGLASKSRAINLDVPPTKTQLTGSFAPKPPEKRQLSGSFAPKAPPPVVKTQLSGSFAPKKPEKTQLGGSFAPKPAPVPAVPKKNPLDSLVVAKPKPKPKPLSLADFKVAAVKPVTSAPVVPPKPVTPKPVPKAKPAKPKAAPAESSVGVPGSRDPGRPRRGFASQADGKDWASSVWPGSNGYSPEELQALHSYTNDGYRRINGNLRTHKGARGGSRGLNSAMNNAPRVPEEIVVARGTTAAQFGLPKGADLSKLTGQSFTEHGYLSTSVDSRGRMAGEVAMKLSVPKGHKAVYVSGNNKGKNVISAVGGSEAELILNKGTRFVITSVKKVKGQWHVEADIVG